MAYLLSLVTFVPMLGAIVVLLLPRRQEHVTKLATLATTLVTFAISLPVYFRFEAASADYQFVEQRAWIPSLGVT
jgi:NADH-quinone oxidoreductase subunit M